MKLGTQLILPDGREATVVYNSLVGVGCKLGLHNPDPANFEGTNGNLTHSDSPEDWPWEPDVLLREPWAGCERTGFAPDDCVGRECDCEIIRDGLDFIPPWPCQQLHGGRPPYIYQGCDPDTGLCHHEECNRQTMIVCPNAQISGLYAESDC